MKKPALYKISNARKLMKEKLGWEPFGRTSFYTRCRSGEIRARRINGHYFVPAAELQRIIAQYAGDADRDSQC